MLIDTHCHLQFPNFDDDRDEILDRCEKNNVAVINIGCEYESSAAAIQLAEKHHGKLWAVVGQHPTDTGLPFSYPAFLELARSSRTVIGIGECGLDYFRLPTDSVQRANLIEIQKDLFYNHLNLSHELHLPLVIHCRDAHEDLIEILYHRYTTAGVHALPKDREHGVLHCFTGTWTQAQSYLDLGFLISFTGVITFADQYDDVVRNVPLEKILIETDSPFLAPVPHRGKKNVPYNVRHVAERIAELKNVSLEEVEDATTANATRLFHLNRVS